MKQLLFLTLFTSILFTQGDVKAAYHAFEKKDYQEAIDLFDDYLDDNENDMNARFYLAQAYFNIKEYEDASDEFEEIIDQGSTNPKHYDWFMNALNEDAKVSSTFGQMSIGKKMINLMKKYYQIKPDSIPIQERYIKMMLNAPSFVGGDEEAGLKSLKDYEKKSPYKANKIYLEIHLEKAERALEKLEAAKDKDKNFYALYNRYGYYLIEKERYSEAIKAFEKQVKLAPANAANPYDSLGDGFKAAGMIEEAKAAYRKALEIDPTLEASKKNLENME